VVAHRAILGSVVPGCRGDVSDLNKTGGRGLAVTNENGVDTYWRIDIGTGRSICEDVRFHSISNKPPQVTDSSFPAVVFGK